MKTIKTRRAVPAGRPPEMLFVAAFIISAIGYWFLQDAEDRRAELAGRPPPSMARRGILWFFLWMISLVLLHFAGFSTGSGSGSGIGRVGSIGLPFVKIGEPGAPIGGPVAAPSVTTVPYDPTEMLKRIPEEITVGVAPF